jgi:hypothetical protein
MRSLFVCVTIAGAAAQTTVCAALVCLLKRSQSSLIILNKCLPCLVMQANLVFQQNLSTAVYTSAALSRHATSGKSLFENCSGYNSAFILWAFTVRSAHFWRRYMAEPSYWDRGIQRYFKWHFGVYLHRSGQERECVNSAGRGLVYIRSPWHAIVCSLCFKWTPRATILETRLTRVPSTCSLQSLSFLAQASAR